MKHRFAALAVLCLLSADVTAKTDGPTVHLADGKKRQGSIALNQGSLAIVVVSKDASKTHHVSLLDVDRVVFAAKASTPKPGKDAWKIALRGGGRLRGKIVSWQDDVLTLAVPTGDVATQFTIATAQVRSIAPAGSKTAAKTNKSQDVVHAYVGEGKGRTVERVAGQVTGIEQGALLFNYHQEQRKIELTRIARVDLHLPEDAIASSPLAFVHELHFGAGSTIRGRWESLDDKTLHWRTEWDVAVSIPLGSVQQVRILNGRYVSLTEAKPVSSDHTPYFDRAMTYRVNAAFDGSPLKLTTGAVSRGLCLHSRSILHYDIGGQFASFTATCGLQTPQGAAGDATIRVRGDGIVLFEHKRLRGSDTPVLIDMSIADVKRLTLEVDFGAGQDVGDWVVWADPRLRRADDGG